LQPGKKNGIDGELSLEQHTEEVIGIIKKRQEDKKKKENSIEKLKEEVKGYKGIMEKTIIEKALVEKEVEDLRRQLAKQDEKQSTLQNKSRKDDRKEEVAEKRKEKKNEKANINKKGGTNSTVNPLKACIFFNKGNTCKFGQECRYEHKKICHSVLQGEECQVKNRCRDSHDVTAICRFKENCKYGDKCKYIHKGGKTNKDRARLAESQDSKEQTTNGIVGAEVRMKIVKLTLQY